MKGQSARRERVDAPAQPLDMAASEAIERFALVMAQCRFSPSALVRAFEHAITAAQVKADRPKQRQVLRELPEAAHLVTLWCSSSDYVDERGAPRPLPARGSGRSIETLARAVDPSLDLGELLRYLLRTQTLRKVGRTYALNRRWVYVRGVPGYAHARSIRALNGMLRTLNHNLVAQTDAAGWFEFIAENQHFPVSQLPALERRVRREGLGSLRKLDLYMQRCAAECDPTEPTVWVGISMHRYQHDRPTFTSSIRRLKPAAKRRVKRRRRR